MNPSIDGPAAGTSVVLRLPAGQAVTGSVTTLEGSQFTFTPDTTPPPSPGPLRVDVQWCTARGVHDAIGEASLTAAEATVRLLEEPSREQRRDAARVPVRLPASVQDLSGTKLVTTVDISEGGARLEFEKSGPALVLGAKTRIVIDVPGELTLDQAAEVVRIDRVSDTLIEVGVRFVGMPERVATRVRQFVFVTMSKRARSRDNG